MANASAPLRSWCAAAAGRVLLRTERRLRASPGTGAGSSSTILWCQRSGCSAACLLLLRVSRGIPKFAAPSPVESSMHASLVRSARGAIPLHAVKADNLKRWLPTRGKREAEWLRAANFAAKEYELLLVPNGSGGLAAAVLGL